MASSASRHYLHEVLVRHPDRKYNRPFWRLYFLSAGCISYPPIRHTHARPIHTFVLGPSVTEAVACPVLLAGGIRDGRGLAAALAFGADAVALGTCFVASHDNPDWHPAYGARIIAAAEGEDIVFQALHGPSRALPSAALDELAALEAGGITSDDALTRFKDERLIAAQRDGDMQGGILPAGQIAGAINDLIHVAEFVPGMVEEALAVLDRLAQLRT